MDWNIRASVVGVVWGLTARDGIMLYIGRHELSAWSAYRSYILHWRQSLIAHEITNSSEMSLHPSKTFDSGRHGTFFKLMNTNKGSLDRDKH